MSLFHEDRQQRADDAWRDYDRRMMDRARFATPDFWGQVQAAVAAPSPLAAMKQQLAHADRLLSELEAVAPVKPLAAPRVVSETVENSAP